MPVRDEARYIERAVASVQASAAAAAEAAAETGAEHELEILVVDGMSDDGTAAIVTALAAADPRIRLLENPQRTVPHAMNLGITNAAGDIVIRLDGHAEMDVDFIANAVAELDAHPECACVGGPIENVNEGTIAEAVSAAMGSPFGVGNARFRTGGEDGYVDTLAFGAYRKADLVAIGLFDEELIRNQDDELNYRLVRAGRKIWFSNRIRSRYFVRSAFPKLYRQYFQYGYWKVYVNRKHRTVTNLRQLAPPLLVAALVALLPASPFSLPARVLLAVVVGLYALAAVSFALLTRPRSVRRLSLVIAAFAILHFSYGLGFWAGLIDFGVLRNRPNEARGAPSR